MPTLVTRGGAALAAALTAAVIGAAAAPSAAQPRFPEPSGWIVDDAGVIADDREQQIEAALDDYHGRTSGEVAVAVVRSMGGASIEDYATDLFADWGVGDKKQDSGVLLVIAMDERRTRIETGYGAEAELTDLEADDILEDQVRPRMRAGDVAAAVDAGQRAIRAALGDPTADAPAPARGSGERPSGTGTAAPWLPLLFFTLPFPSCCSVPLAEATAGGPAAGATRSSSVAAGGAAAGTVATAAVASEAASVVLAEAASEASGVAAPAAAAPVATGDERGPLSERQLRRIAREVDGAEELTGLQFAVYLGPTSEDSRAHAESMLVELGHTGVPAVLLLVAPEQRRLEIVTSPSARKRVPDRHAALAAASMTASFAVGDVVGGVCVGIQMLARYAGPPALDARPEPELPDVLSAWSVDRPKKNPDTASL